MSPVLEFESKSVEEAVQKASRKLNIPPDKLAHDIISYGSTGIFGLVGSKKAKIRVVVPDDVEKKTIGTRAGEIKKSRDEASAIVDETFGKTIATEVSDENVTLGKEALQKIVDFISTDAVISVNHNDGNLVYEVSGGETAVLIGKRGQTLEAMQYLVEKIINKQNEQRVRVQVDIEGYLQKQRQRLENLALRLSEKVKKTGKPVTVGQFNAHDRRVIHVALKEDREVRTHSVGEGYYRKLKIYPKRRRGKNPS